MANCVTEEEIDAKLQLLLRKGDAVVMAWSEGNAALLGAGCERRYARRGHRRPIQPPI